MIGTHSLGNTPREGGARERVTDVQGYTGALRVMIMVRDHDGTVWALWNYDGIMQMMRERVERDAGHAGYVYIHV